MKDPIQHLYDAMDVEGWEEARNHSAPPRRFRASEASNCVRRIWHRLNGDRPAPRNATSGMYGVCGDADHDITRQLLNHHNPDSVTGVTHEDDGSITENLLMRETYTVVMPFGEVNVVLTCRADGIIKTPRGECLLEIKGMGFWPYSWLNKEFAKSHDEGMVRLREKHGSYYDQCQIAMHLSGHKLTYLVVKDRATGRLGLHNEKTDKRFGIYIEYNPEHVELLLKRFAGIQHKLHTGIAPIAERPDGSYECNFCEFYYRCHGLFNTGKISYPGPQVEEYIEETK